MSRGNAVGGLQRVLRLPLIGGRRGLPLSGAGGLELVAALVPHGACSSRAPDPGAASSLLALEPGLALWLVCRAASSQTRAELRTLPAAAEWFVANILRELGDWGNSFATEPHMGPPHDEKSPAWDDLTVAALNLAALAERMAKDALPWAAAEAYWLGLLRAAPRWMSAASGNRSADGASLGELPHWLADAISNESQSLATPSGCVNQALALLHASHDLGASNVLPADWPSAEHKASVTAAHDRWHRPWADVAWVPALVTRLVQCERLERSFHNELEQQKLASLKELAYGAGHEINNPLANISARAQTLLQEETDPDRRRRLAAINSQAFRAYEMIADMMLFARPPEPKPERFDVGKLIGQVLEGIAPGAAEQATTVTYSAPVTPLEILADPTQISVAVHALCTNSLEAIGRGGRLTVTLVPQMVSQGFPKEIRIVVSDDGPGIRPEIRKHLFDPFFSGREAGRGLGFGLSKCWRIVTEHGGRIEVDNGPSTGAIFTIWLPSAGPLATACIHHLS